MNKYKETGFKDLRLMNSEASLDTTGCQSVTKSVRIHNFVGPSLPLFILSILGFNVEERCL